MKRSWICAVAVFFRRMTGGRGAQTQDKYEIRASGLDRPARTSVVLILLVGIALLFSQTIRSQTIKMRSHDVKNGEHLY